MGYKRIFINRGNLDRNRKDHGGRPVETVLAVECDDVDGLHVGYEADIHGPSKLIYKPYESDHPLGGDVKMLWLETESPVTLDGTEIP